MEVKIIKNGRLKKIIGTKYFLVTDSFIFFIIFYSKKYLIKVDKGFITDFGSIPSIFFFFDKTKYISYIMHDFLYSLKGKISNINGLHFYTRDFSDDVLYSGLKNEGMNFGRYLIRIGVGIGGFISFKKKNKKIEKLKLILNIK